MKTNLTLSVILALALGITLLSTLSSAAEFSYDGPPAFTVTYPGGSSEEEKTSPRQVLRIQYPPQCFVVVGVSPIPEGIALKDYAEKVYKPFFEKLVGGPAWMSDNKEITLSDGTKAYYSELNWTYIPNGVPCVTMLVSAYKDGKMVTVEAYSWLDYGKYEKIVKSLKFK